MFLILLILTWGLKRRDNRIRDICFEMGVSDNCCALVLRVQENLKLSLSPFFLYKKEWLLNVLLTWPWLLDSLDLPRYGLEWWQPGWCLWLTLVLTNVQLQVCYQETFCVLIYGEAVYIYNYKDVLNVSIFSPFVIWE